ncbi:MAG: DUF4389 domain-containing protein [Candidatus Diapherotrites archaeon]
MNTVQVEITIEEKASRIEWIFRIIYFIVLYIIGGILGLVAFFMIGLNFLTTLILGKRIIFVANLIRAYLKYTTKMATYILGVTDERPPIIPEL